MVRQEVTVVFDGRQVKDSYTVSADAVTAISFTGSSKTVCLGAHSATLMAEIGLREMAAEGKA